jgi:murein DD-endopeptidase MepM/ murein hydrolase activator NlpD
MPSPNTSLAAVLLPRMIQQQRDAMQEAAAMAEHDWKYRILWPLDENRIRGGIRNNAFGANVRIDQKTGAPRDHQGWDLLARVGTPCYAIAMGRVGFTDKAPVGEGYGWQVCMSFKASIFNYTQTTFYAFYGHLSQISVNAGEVVTPDTQIGLTGKTGNAVNLAVKDDHLHFEIRTTPNVGGGLKGRVNPAYLYGFTPFVQAAVRTPEGVKLR